MDLVKKLKDAPQGTILYSPIVGDDSYSFTREGKYYIEERGECVLFPSKDNRNWDNISFKNDGYNSCNNRGDTLWRYIIPVDKFDFENAGFDKCDNYGSITW